MTKKRPVTSIKKWYHNKAVVVLSVVASISVLLILSFKVPIYIRDHLVDKPLAPGFVYIQQDITNGWLEMPTQTFYYATDIPPNQFASRFAGWKTYGTVNEDDTGSRTGITIEKDGHFINATYCTYEQCKRDPLKATNFKGKKYIVYLHGASMYFLNSENIDSSMRQSVLDEVKSNHIR
jgi:hypothetical protein